MVREIRVKDIPENYEKLLAPSNNKRVSIGMESKIREYFQIEIDNIKPYHKQARKIFDNSEIEQLANTIKVHGVRQPLAIIKCFEHGKYEVVSGERRLRAAKLAGLTKVPCILINDAENIEEIALIENIQREDLHPIELANVYSSLLKDYKYGDITSFSKRIGVSKSHVSEILGYRNLPEDIKEYLLKTNIKTRNILRKLVQLDNLSEMHELLGLTKLTKKPTNEKQLFKISLINNNINISDFKQGLSEKQKDDLKIKLQEIINIL